MKTIVGVIIGAGIVVVVIMGVLSYQNNKKTDNSGSLIIGITDATADISNVNDVNLSVKKIEIYSATKGWVSISSDTKNYKLLALNASGKTELYTKTNVLIGEYNKIRITLGDVVVNTKSKGDVKATLPSSYIVIDTNLKIKENKDTSIKLDVLADQSLHTTIDGEYVFAPVVKTESRSSAKVSIETDNIVLISGGDIDSNTTVGVDFDGTSKTNFRAESDSSLKVETSITGEIKFLLGGKVFNKNEKTPENTENSNEDSSNGSVDVNLKGGVKIN